MQTQSQTGGFHKPRDVVGLSYYERLMAEKKKLPSQLKRDCTQGGEGREMQTALDKEKEMLLVEEEQEGSRNMHEEEEEEVEQEVDDDGYIRGTPGSHYRSL